MDAKTKLNRKMPCHLRNNSLSAGQALKHILLMTWKAIKVYKWIAGDKHLGLDDWWNIQGLQANIKIPQETA